MTSTDIYSSEKILPYVYLCTHKENGTFYIGSRTSNKLNLPSHKDMFWVMQKNLIPTIQDQLYHIGC